MSEAMQIITVLKEIPREDRAGICRYLLNMTDKVKLKKDEKAALYEIAREELQELLVLIPAAGNYKAKSELADYAELLLSLCTKTSASPAELPESLLLCLHSAAEMIHNLRSFENAVDKLFSQEDVYPAYIEQLINTHRALTDEDQKAQLYAGMLHYKDKLVTLSDECKAMFSHHLADELTRLSIAPLSSVCADNLEILVDVARYVPDDRLLDAVAKIADQAPANVTYFALDTLLYCGRELSPDAVVRVANDLSYAILLYNSLQEAGKPELIPAELNDPIYLAKSDLVHWLIYPTELGEVPDEIEYIGETKSDGELFRIFRFRSDSDNLQESAKGQWLLGWSGSEGGTFSNFDLYADYEKETPEKTVKYIKKKVL